MKKKKEKHKLTLQQTFYACRAIHILTPIYLQYTQRLCLRLAAVEKKVTLFATNTAAVRIT